jgi:hypothetical protein
MLVDLTDAASVRAWLKVAPERHRSILRGLWRIWPQHRAAIEAGALPAVADQPPKPATTVTKKAPSGASSGDVGSRSTTGRRARCRRGGCGGLDQIRYGSGHVALLCSWPMPCERAYYNQL